MNKFGRRFKAISWLMSALMILTMIAGVVPVFAQEGSLGDNPNGDFYAYVPYTPGAPLTTYAFETPGTGVVSLEFDVTPLEDVVNGHIAFNTVDWTMAFSGDRKINIMLTSEGQFAANNNTATVVPETEIPYLKGETYHVEVTIDIANKTYNATVDGKVLAQDYAFRNANPRDITNIGVMGVVAAEGSFKVTNISEKLVGLVDNDTIGMDEANNPARVNGANVYYVGPTHKFKKVQDVVAMLQPGDIVEVDGDATYPAPIFVDGKIAGTKDKPITIKGISKNGSRPVIKTRNALNSVEIVANNYVIDNFEIAGNLGEVLKNYEGVTYGNVTRQKNAVTREISNKTSFRGVFHKGDNLVVRNCVIHDFRNGIMTSDIGSGSITLEYSEIYHNGIRNTEHNIYLSADEVAYPDSVARVQFNYIHDSNAGNGLKTRARRNEVYYNWFENNFHQSLELIGPDPGFETLADDEGNTYYSFPRSEGLREINPEYGEFFQREDSDVVGNVIIHTQGAHVRVGGDGTSDTSVIDDNWVLELGEDGMPVKNGPCYGQTYGRYRFVNNTFIHYNDDEDTDSLQRSIRIEFGVESVELYNNVFYKPAGSPMKIVDENKNPLEINIAKWASGERLVKGANNWVQVDAQDVPEEWIGTIKGTDPGFVDANAAVKNYNLKSDSPLIGAGIGIDKTVAVWPDWENTLYDFSAGKWYDFMSYQGTPVEMKNADNSFPNPLMTVGFQPVDPKTFTVKPRLAWDSVDIGAFGADINVTRAEFLKQLVASFDSIKMDDLSSHSFKDVAAGSIYEKAILWAFTNGVTKGISADTFGVNLYVTREDMAVFIDRFTNALGIELPQVYAGEAFKDADLVSDYAKDAVVKLQRAGIINGKGNGIYDPKGNLTRSETLKVISEILKVK